MRPRSPSYHSRYRERRTLPTGSRIESPPPRRAPRPTTVKSNGSLAPRKGARACSLYCNIESDDCSLSIRMTTVVHFGKNSNKNHTPERNHGYARALPHRQGAKHYAGLPSECLPMDGVHRHSSPPDDVETVSFSAFYYLPLCGAGPSLTRSVALRRVHNASPMLLPGPARLRCRCRRAKQDDARFQREMHSLDRLALCARYKRICCHSTEIRSSQSACTATLPRCSAECVIRNSTEVPPECVLRNSSQTPVPTE